MTVRVGSRRRWGTASAAGLMVAGAAWAQITSSGVLPPASAVPVVPMGIPAPMINPVTEAESQPVTAMLPPLVVTLPTPPTKAVTVAQTVPVTVQEPRVPAIPAVRITPIETVEAVPMIVTPMTEVPAVVVPNTTVSKSAKPAMAEIISVGPKAVDASASFSHALDDAKTAMTKVRDYSGHFIHQERSKGTLAAEQTAELRVRQTPRSIALKYIAPSNLVGKELVFVDGRNANKVRVKAAGTYGTLAFSNHALSDAKAAVDSRHTLAETGLIAVLERVERALITESKLRNPVSITAGDFTFANKVVVRYELCFDRPHGLRDAARMVVCIDPDTKLPVRLEIYDAPTAGRLEGDLREAVSFVNLSFNKGLGDGPFEK
ncbi:hypothetical protein BH11PLA2_BH11PLA2_07430 [soil metagenome]